MLPLSDITAAFRWWLALMILGVAVLPLSYTLLARLPDRGYAFTKMLGLLLVAYLFWLLGSLGILGNDLGGVLVALALVTGASLWVNQQSGINQQPSGVSFQPSAFSLQPLAGWLRQNGRYVVVTELVFALVFILWVWARAQNPAIEHTEKPMEFAFLNGVGRSAFFPPLDPWLSGYAISYYYFGYVMTSLLGRLAFVAEPVAFNLAIAWLAAGTAVGAFGLVYNLIMSGEKEGPARASPAATATAETSKLFLRRQERRSLGWRGNLQRHAIIFGLVAVLALPLAGNLQILMEILHANRVGSTEFWAWLDVRDIDREPPELGTTPRYQTADWWWWRSSRVIREYHLSGGEADTEPIAEFPAFSFALGDLHPHVLALPFAFLSLAMALAWWHQSWPESWPPASDGGHAAVDAAVGPAAAGNESVTDGRAAAMDANGGHMAASMSAARRLFTPEQLGLWVLTILVLGGLAFLNTWDVLIHLFVIVAAFALALWRDRGRWDAVVTGQAAVAVFLLALPALLLYLPFYLGFRSQAGPPFILPMLMRPTRLVHFLIFFGMPLLGVVAFLVTVIARQRFRHWQTGLAAAVATVLALTFLTFVMGWIIAASQEGAWRVINLAHELEVSLPLLPAEAPALYRLRWGLAAVLNLAPAFLAARVQYGALTLLLAALIGLGIMALTALMNRPHDVAARPDHKSTSDSPRATRHSSLPFVLLLVVAGALLTLAPEFVYLYDVFGVRLNTIFKFYYQAWVLFGVAALFGLSTLLRHVRPLALPVTAAYGLLLAVALLFPIYAVSSRAQWFRGPVTAGPRAQPTLNGLAHVERNNPDEYAALMWLRENVAGTPVILEAVGGQYSNYGRISAGTGLPTVLGWPGHQHQWRGSTVEPARREPAVETIYSRLDWDQAIDLLNRYRVAYIYVGGLERSTYGLDGLEKFDHSLPVAYANRSVTIYRWQPSSTDWTNLNR
jgi:YYY domain-containing protein